MPSEQASTRKMPQKKVSPMPESGPMSETLMEFTAEVSSALSLANISSIASVMPMTKVEGAHVMLKAAMWRRMAARRPSSSPE